MPNEDDAVNAGGNGMGAAGIDLSRGDVGTGMSALDVTGSGGAQVDAYGGGLDLGIGGGPTGHGGFDLALDRGPQPGVMSLQGNGMPSIGQPSSIGSKIGTGLSLLGTVLGFGVPGLIAKEAATYGPGAFNSAFGLAGGPAPLGPGGMAAPGEKSASSTSNSAGAGLLGIGGDTSNADALAQLYMMLKAQGVAA